MKSVEGWYRSKQYSVLQLLIPLAILRPKTYITFAIEKINGTDGEVGITF